MLVDPWFTNVQYMSRYPDFNRANQNQVRVPKTGAKEEPMEVELPKDEPSNEDADGSDEEMPDDAQKATTPATAKAGPSRRMVTPRAGAEFGA